MANPINLYDLSCTALIDRLLDDAPCDEIGNGYDIKFHTRLWDFCRTLRGHPDLKQKSGREVLALVEQRLKHRKETWEGVFEGVRCTEDARAEFLDVWQKIRFVPGEMPLETAYEKARNNPIELPKEFQETECYRDFVGVAYYLQMGNGENRAILLPEQKLAELLRCSPMTVSRYRGWAKREGLLREVKPHSFDRKSRKGKATEFIFSFERLAQIQRGEQ